MSALSLRGTLKQTHCDLSPFTPYIPARMRTARDTSNTTNKADLSSRLISSHPVHHPTRPHVFIAHQPGDPDPSSIPQHPPSVSSQAASSHPCKPRPSDLRSDAKLGLQPGQRPCPDQRLFEKDPWRPIGPAAAGANTGVCEIAGAAESVMALAGWDPLRPSGFRADQARSARLAPRTRGRWVLVSAHPAERGVSPGTNTGQGPDQRAPAQASGPGPPFSLAVSSDPAAAQSPRLKDPLPSRLSSQTLAKPSKKTIPEPPQN